MKRILCVWIPNWPIQRLVAARPELSGRPVVLHARPAAGRASVVACSPAARRSGVRVGMPLTEAAALLKRGHCESAVPLHLEAHTAQGDRRALLELAQWCEQFSPLVGIEEAWPVRYRARREERPQERRGVLSEPDCLLLEVTRLGPLFGGEDALARIVVAEFQRRGYQAQVAVADTIGTAWGVVHYGKESGGEQEREWGSGEGPECRSSMVIPPGKNLAALAGLPVEALRLPESTCELLQRLGIFQIQQLLRLPRASLSSRFGDLLLLRLDQASGAAAEVIQAHRPPPEFQAEWLLEYPTARRETLELVLSQLMQRVTELLAQRDVGVVQLVCRWDCAADAQSEPSLRHPAPLQIRLDLFHPSTCPQHLLELAQMQLERLALPGPVGRVVVQAVITAPLEYRQGELFADGMREAGRHLALLVDRLSSRLGSQCVVSPRLHADAQPERAFCYLPLAGQRVASGSSSAPRPPHVLPGPLQRPLVLRSPPQRLSVVAVAPDGPPVRFVDQNRQHQVVRYWGPERIETGWWRGHSVRRDYYRIETESGRRFWLFRQLEDGEWFLHGEFE